MLIGKLKRIIKESVEYQFNSTFLHSVDDVYRRFNRILFYTAVLDLIGTCAILAGNKS